MSMVSGCLLYVSRLGVLHERLIILNTVTPTLPYTLDNTATEHALEGRQRVVGFQLMDLEVG